MLSSALLSTVLQVCVALGVALAAPTVTLDAGVFTGKFTSSNTESFLGIPFAQPPCVFSVYMDYSAADAMSAESVTCASVFPWRSRHTMGRMLPPSMDLVARSRRSSYPPSLARRRKSLTTPQTPSMASLSHPTRTVSRAKHRRSEQETDPAQALLSTSSDPRP